MRVGSLNSLDMFGAKTLSQHILPAAPNDCVEQQTTEHRACGSEQGKVEDIDRRVCATHDDEVIIDFGKRKKGGIKRADDDHRWPGAIDRHSDDKRFEPLNDSAESLIQPMKE